MSSLLFAPAVTLLNQLRLTHKFLLIFILYVIPVTYITYISVTDHSAGIYATQKEQLGLEYLAALRPLLENIAQTRGMTNAYLNGKPEFRQKIEAKRTLVNRGIKILLEVDGRLGETLRIGEQTRIIQRDWENIEANAFNMQAEAAFAEHTRIIKQVLSLMRYVLETSALLQDPDIDSYFLAGMVGESIPQLVESMGKARGLGAGVTAQGSFSQKDYLKLTGMVQALSDHNADIQHAFNLIFQNNPLLQQQLGALQQSADAATMAFTNMTHTELLEPEKISITAENYFQQGTQAIAASFKLYDQAVPALNGLLEARLTRLKTNIMINLASSFALLIGAIYLFIAFHRSMMNAINHIKTVVHQVADGDLTVSLELETKDEMQLIAHDMNAMIEKNHALVSQVISATNQVVTAADESHATSVQTREGVNKQSAEIEQVATAINEMSATVQEVASNASSAAEATRSADNEAKNGRHIVQQAIDAINKLSAELGRAQAVIKKLETDSESIGTVLDVIRGIAEQTNLLALNAAIEAARAGEQGRGFAVVADEVRTLASRTQQSTAEINQMIGQLQQGARNAVQVMEDGNQQSQQTVEQAAKAGTALETITAAVVHIAQMNDQIASAAEEQSSVAEEINRNVVTIRDITLDTVDGAEQTATSSETLRGVASQLQSLISEFKVK